MIAWMHWSFWQEMSYFHFSLENVPKGGPLEDSFPFSRLTCPPTPCRNPPDTFQTPFRDPPDTLKTPCGHLPDTSQTPFRYPIKPLQTPIKYSHNIRHDGSFLLVKVRWGFLLFLFLFLFFLWQGENKVNSYSDQLKLGQVSKFGVEFDNNLTSWPHITYLT